MAYCFSKYNNKEEGNLRPKQNINNVLVQLVLKRAVLFGL